MALVSIHSFRTLPGKAAEHRARTEEARQLLQEQGLAAFSLDCLAGAHVGQLAVGVEFADNRAYTDSLQQTAANEKWQQFMAETFAQPIAQPTEVSLYVDTDPTFVHDPDQAFTVLQTTQWRAMPGRAMAFMESVGQAKGHIERLGGIVRVMQSMIGAEPMTAVVAVEFEDLDHFGDYSDKLGADEGFQTYWTGVAADPTAVLVRSGLYTVTV